MRRGWAITQRRCMGVLALGGNATRRICSHTRNRNQAHPPPPTTAATTPSMASCSCCERESVCVCVSLCVSLCVLSLSLSLNLDLSLFLSFFRSPCLSFQPSFSGRESADVDKWTDCHIRKPNAQAPTKPRACRNHQQTKKGKKAQSINQSISTWCDFCLLCILPLALGTLGFFRLFCL